MWRLADRVRDCVYCVDFPSPLQCLAAHPLQALLFAGGTDGCVYPMPLIHSPLAHVGSGDSAAGATAGAPAAAAASAAHDGAVRGLCVSADGKLLFSCAAAGGVWVWDPSTLALMQKLLPEFAAETILLVRTPPLHADVAPPPPLLAPFKKYAEPRSETAAQSTALAMGCVLVRLWGLAFLLDADHPDLPILDLELQPASPNEAALHGALSTSHNTGGQGCHGATEAELRHQVQQYRKINAELYQLVAQTLVGS